MELKILGPLEAVDDDGADVHLGGPRVRAVLARLAIQPNTAVATDTLIDAVWGESPPARATGALQVHVHALRKALGADRIVTRAPGYVLALQPDELDAMRFESLVDEGARLVASGDHAAAATTLADALALWRGPALADVAYEAFAQREAERLDELRLVAIERRLDVEIELGRHVEAVAELDALVREHPLREGLWMLLMQALYRSNRQAEALEAYRKARAVLVDELGIEPSPALRELEQAILRQDPALRPVAAPTERLSPPEALVGRELELAAVTGLLRRADVRFVTLSGTGGTGKTRLALAAADEIGGAVVVDLAPLSDPELVLPTIGAALGDDDTGTVIERVAAACASGLQLLVLDNLEHLPAAHADVGRLAASVPEVTFLVTSRVPLRLAIEQEYRVPPLAVPEQGAASAAEIEGVAAVRLYVERIRAFVPSFVLSDANAPAVARVCRALDGLPLALELAAARVRVLGPEGTANRLGERLGLLARDTPDVPARQRSLRATIDWSYDLLDEDAQRVLRSLGVFAGAVRLDAVSQVAGLDATDALETLLDADLVLHLPDETGEPRFGMLETVREYALERLTEAGEEHAASERHLDHYLEVVEALAETEQTADVQDAAAAELPEIRSALSWSEQRADPEAQLRLVFGIRFWFHGRGDRGEWMRIVAAAYERSATAPPELRTRILIEAGSAASDEGDEARAVELYRRGLPDLEAAGDWVTAGRVYANLGGSLALLGRLDEAIPSLERSAEILHGLGDDRRYSHALTQLAEVLMRKGEYELARAKLFEALRMLEPIGSGLSLAYGLYMTGAVCRHTGDVPEAASYTSRALDEIGRIGHEELLGYVLISAAELLVEPSPRGSAELIGAACEALRRAGVGIQAGEAESIAAMRETLLGTLGPEELESCERVGAADAIDGAVARGVELLRPLAASAT
jgi:predicted ATPase/DNA-binding SARP family transcriptional activator